jgi:hypothetical protein
VLARIFGCAEGNDLTGDLVGGGKLRPRRDAQPRSLPEREHLVGAETDGRIGRFPMNSAGSSPANRASRSAASPVRPAGGGRVANGPFSGRARSSAGSAMPIASAKFTHGARSIKTGAVGTPSRWLVSFSVAARLPEIRRSAGPTRSSSANASASAVSMASSPLTVQG